MPRHIPVLVAVSYLGVTCVTPVELAAQTPASVSPTAQIGRQASMREGRIKGIVRDDAGQAVRGVSVVAMGTILATVRSDERGQFSLALPPGEYILRATCDGYLSTYREPVRVHTSGLLEREITLTRQGMAPRPVLLASTAGASTSPASAASTAPAPPAETATGEHAHTEAAWRLRHLTRSILRDGPVGTDEIVSEQNRTSFQPRASFFGRAVEGSARVASAFFSETNFDGQVNFLTTSVMGGTSGWMPAEWPRGIAYLAVGAPVGRHGDWRMRGAITAGDASTWVLVGEYQARADTSHAFRVGVSYSAQGYDPHTSSRWAAATTDAKNVAGVYGFDRWRVAPFVAIDYGLRLDRYDYVESPNLVSPEIGVRLDVLPRTFARVQVARWMIAPGADEFLPPVSSGAWVPPERTFSSLVPNVAPRVEEVRHYEFGLGHQLGGRTDSTIFVRRFHQSSANQIATLFGIDAASDVGHYYVATPGNVELDGWGARVSARFAHRFGASADYTAAAAEWTRGRQSWAVRRVAPSVLRPDREQVHDLTSTFDADLPETLTRITLIYRVSSAFSQPDAALRPVPAGRLDVEIRQALPYRPPGGGRLDVLVAVRTLMRDPRERSAFYDELLTVAPPMRLMGGVQMKF